MPWLYDFVGPVKSHTVIMISIFIKCFLHEMKLLFEISCTASHLFINVHFIMIAHTHYQYHWYKTISQNLNYKNYIYSLFTYRRYSNYYNWDANKIKNVGYKIHKNPIVIWRCHCSFTIFVYLTYLINQTRKNHEA